jgi:hypothetical protein
VDDQKKADRPRPDDQKKVDDQKKADRPRPDDQKKVDDPPRPDDQKKVDDQKKADRSRIYRNFDPTSQIYDRVPCTSPL